MRKLLTTMLAGLVLSATACSGASAAAYDPWVIGHRGDPSKAPEATVSSYKAAVSGGADVIEMDVQWTKDQKMITTHDYGPNALVRTTKCTGRLSVQEYTYAQIHRCAPEIPTFDQAVKAVKASGKKIMPDIVDKGITPTQARQFVKVIRDNGVAKRTIIQSRNYKTVQWLSKYNSDIPRGYITYKASRQPSFIKSIGAQYYVVDSPSISAKNVGIFQTKEGIRVLLYVATNDPVIQKSIIAKKPYGIITDNVRLTQSLI